MLRKLVVLTLALLCIFKLPLQADFFGIHGKASLGGTLVELDILESGKTIDTLRMPGVKADLSLYGWKGIFIKTGGLYAERRGRLATCYVGIGQCLPVHERLTLMPSVGVAFSYMRTSIDLEPLGLFDLRERFRSTSPYLSLEFYYKITEELYLMGTYQYAWSHTHTTIEKLVSDKSHSVGPNYALALEYCLTREWVVIAGVGYNITLTKEKHGLRGKGAFLGIGYYF